MTRGYRQTAALLTSQKRRAKSSEPPLTPKELREFARAPEEFDEIPRQPQRPSLWQRLVSWLRKD